MRTVYCIALEGEWDTGVDWYDKREDREAAKGKTGAEKEIYFTMEVPDDADDDEVTLLVDTAAWEMEYTPEV